MSAPRCLVIGIDGADYALFRGWMAEGLTPRLAGLARRGRLGVLRSTYPPVTAPAWVTLTTGEQPGTHGITGFSAPPATPGSLTRSTVSSLDVSAPFLWELAARHGRKGIVVNVPLTWPVRPFDGILVSGMLTPPDRPFTHPPEYEPELHLLQPDYRRDVAWQEYRNRGHDLVKDQGAATRARIELCLKLMEAKPWDLFFAVFTGPDRLQHCLFPHVERMHRPGAARENTLTAAVRDYFVRLDEGIGELIDGAGADTNVMVVSDHGFHRLDRTVYFNRWLVDAGLLVLKSGNAAGVVRTWKSWLNRVGVRRSDVASLLRRVGLPGTAVEAAQRLNPFVAGIDWERTRAYYLPTNGFVVNRAGREPFGSVGAEDYESVRDDLIARLRGLRDPATDLPMLARAERREDLFAGPRLDVVPDVFVDFGDAPYDAFAGDYDVPEFTRTDDWSNGTHRAEGLFIGAGPDLADGGEVQGLQAADIVPNVLHALGLPVPEGLDGEHRPELFRDPAPPSREKVPRAAAGVGTLTAEESRRLEQQLKGLGYL